ncbi:hypothetical protein MMC17_005422 [Xylographa soralifera]|nr:hypothetical protein [Xylographa soralifera]
MEDDNSPVVEIDPKGDVVLELNCSDATTRLLVSSKILAMVSPVFAAMFNSQFKEGLHNTKPGLYPAVPLPEDDAIAFEVICNVVHYRHKHVPLDPPLKQLVNIAIIADKYEIREPLYAYSVLWLRSGMKNHTGKNHIAADWNKLLFAAYVLDTPDEFTSISWEIMLYHVGPYLSLSGITYQALITHDPMAEFDARAAKIHNELIDVYACLGLLELPFISKALASLKHVQKTEPDHNI